MRSRDGSEGKDERDESGSGCNRIRQQCNRSVSVCKALCHNARTDYGGEQHRCAERFSGDTLPQIFNVQFLSSSSLLNLSWN
jgi:hypothetical protein